jgi:hypothetical protein
MFTQTFLRGTASLAQRGEAATTHRSRSEQISIAKSGDDPHDKPARPARLSDDSEVTLNATPMELAQTKNPARLAQRAERAEDMN